MFKSGPRRRGFTLIELLIVIVVISILALIVIPRLMGAARKSKEATLRANLQVLRNAIAQFQADTGVYPGALKDVVAAEGSTPTGTPTGTYKGPYLTPSGGLDDSGIPLNPFGAAPTGTLDTDIAAHWNYASGEVHSPAAITGSTMDGSIAYTAL